MGKELDFSKHDRIETELDDLLLHYTFNFSIYYHIDLNSLLNHIEGVGGVFYIQKATSREGLPNWPVKTVNEIAEHSLDKMLDKKKSVGIPRRYLRNVNVRWFEFELGDLKEMRIGDE